MPNVKFDTTVNNNRVTQYRIDAPFLLRSALRGNYQKQKLKPENVYEICCYIANKLMKEKETNSEVTKCLQFYQKKINVKYLETVFLCTKTLLDVIQREKVSIKVKDNIFQICFDMLNFINDNLNTVR